MSPGRQRILGIFQGLRSLPLEKKQSRFLGFLKWFFGLPKNAGPSKLRARCCSTPRTPLNAALAIGARNAGTGDRRPKWNARRRLGLGSWTWVLRLGVGGKRKIRCFVKSLICCFIGLDIEYWKWWRDAQGRWDSQSGYFFSEQKYYWLSPVRLKKYKLMLYSVFCGILCLCFFIVKCVIVLWQKCT